MVRPVLFSLVAVALSWANGSARAWEFQKGDLSGQQYGIVIHHANSVTILLQCWRSKPSETSLSLLPDRGKYGHAYEKLALPIRLTDNQDREFRAILFQVERGGTTFFVALEGISQQASEMIAAVESSSKSLQLQFSDYAVTLKMDGSAESVDRMRKACAAAD